MNEQGLAAGTEGLYDVLLASRPPKSVLAPYPHTSIGATGRRTRLRHQINGPAQLDVLLEKLFSLGLAFVELHRLSATESEQTYEVLVDGRIGAPVLQYLNWPAQVVEAQTRVRIRAASADLHEFLRACTASGACVERVHRIDAVA